MATMFNSSFHHVLTFFSPLPRQEFSTFKDGLSMSGGDYGSVCQLFFDNLSTLLGALFALQALSSPAAFGDIAVSEETMSQYVWGHIVPGVGVTMVVGNLYYTWQAIRYVTYTVYMLKSS
jgi:hypothetical protein